MPPHHGRSSDYPVCLLAGVSEDSTQNYTDTTWSEGQWAMTNADHESEKWQMADFRNCDLYGNRRFLCSRIWAI